MGWDAYVFGELRWPMPDPGLIAVWRAMAIDASRWTDWDGFVDAGGAAGTIAALVDAGAPADAPAELVIDEHGVRLRACVERGHEAWWQRVAIAWRLAADLDATGELVWIAGDGGPAGVAYRATVGAGGSRWERLTGAAASAVDALPGRREVESLVKAALARHAPAPSGSASANASANATGAAGAGAKKRAPTAKPVAAAAAPPAAKRKPAAKAKPRRASKRRR